MQHLSPAESADLAHDSAGKPRFGALDERRIQRLEALGRGVLRYGLVALLLLFGALKFTDMEAQGIRPLIEHHPVLSLLYPLFGVRGASALIGVVELCAAALMCLRRVRPRWSAIGSLLASGTFLTTLSFLITTPGVLAPDNPFGGFLMKDIILLGAALYTAAEALGSARQARN